jgi:phosphocarrier protein
MQQREGEIVNNLGIACAGIGQAHADSPPAIACEVSLSRNGRKVNAKSIMGVMMLAANKGSKVIIETDGADEIIAIEALAALIADKFGEDA